MNVTISNEMKNRAKSAGLNVSQITRNAIERALTGLEQPKEHIGATTVKKSTPTITPVKEDERVVSTGH